MQDDGRIAGAVRLPVWLRQAPSVGNLAKERNRHAEYLRQQHEIQTKHDA